MKSWRWLYERDQQIHKWQAVFLIWVQWCSSFIPHQLLRGFLLCLYNNNNSDNNTRRMHESKWCLDVSCMFIEVGACTMAVLELYPGTDIGIFVQQPVGRWWEGPLPQALWMTLFWWWNKTSSRRPWSSGNPPVFASGVSSSLLPAVLINERWALGPQMAFPPVCPRCHCGH